MEETLKILISKLVSSTEHCSIRIISHEGRRKLKRAIPKKLRGWKNARFVILHDQDLKDCKELKKELLKLCQEAGKEKQTTVRIVCRELESWFLGDLNAICKAFDLKKDSRNLNRYKSKDPDSIQKPSKVLQELIPKQTRKNYNKVQGAKLIAEHMQIQQNRSTSFQVFMETLKELLSQFCLESS